MANRQSAPPAVLVIGFGLSSEISRQALDELLANAGCGPNEVWEYMAVPLYGRSQILDSIDRAIAEASDSDGRILPDAFSDCVGGLFDDEH